MDDIDRFKKFVADNGEVFVLKSDWANDGDFLHSSDGVTFYELGVPSKSRTINYKPAAATERGSVVEGEWNFISPYQGVSGRVYRLNDLLEYEGRQFWRDDSPFCPGVVIALPPARAPMYLGQFADGRYVYVSRPAYNWTYEAMKLFVGNGPQMQEYSDTYVTAAEHDTVLEVATHFGVFRAISQGRAPFSGEKRSFKTFLYHPLGEQLPDKLEWTKDDKVTELVNLDLGKFDILETPDGEVIITPL